MAQVLFQLEGKRVDDGKKNGKKTILQITDKTSKKLLETLAPRVLFDTLTIKQKDVKIPEKLKEVKLPFRVTNSFNFDVWTTYKGGITCCMDQNNMAGIHGMELIRWRDVKTVYVPLVSAVTDRDRVNAFISYTKPNPAIRFG